MVGPLVILTILLDMLSMDSLGLCSKKYAESSAIGRITYYLCQAIQTEKEQLKPTKNQTSPKVIQEYNSEEEVKEIPIDTQVNCEFVHHCKAEFAEGILTWFSNELKSCIHQVGFDSLKFQKYLPSFKRDLANIVGVTANTILGHPYLQKQLKFVDLMFDTMKRAANSLTPFEEVVNVENYLLKHMIDVHVRLFAYFNSSGMPISNRDEYEDKAREMRGIIMGYHDVFTKIDRVSKKISTTFMEHHKSASELIQILLNEK